MSHRTDVIYDVQHAFVELQKVVRKLNRLYEENPWLNNIQPVEAENCFPMSLDEWELECGAAIEAWAYEADKVAYKDETNRMVAIYDGFSEPHVCSVGELFQNSYSFTHEELDYLTHHGKGVVGGGAAGVFHLYMVP